MFLFGSQLANIKEYHEISLWVCGSRVGVDVRVRNSVDADAQSSFVLSVTGVLLRRATLPRRNRLHNNLSVRGPTEFNVRHSCARRARQKKFTSRIKNKSFQKTPLIPGRAVYGLPKPFTRRLNCAHRSHAGSSALNVTNPLEKTAASQTHACMVYERTHPLEIFSCRLIFGRRDPVKAILKLK